MGCKKEDMFSQTNLTVLSLGFVPKHLVSEIFGV